MTGRQAIVAALEQTRDYLGQLLGDFSDEDMFARPVPGANHAAWQVGNVIVGDLYLVGTELPGTRYPELPAGFLDLHGPNGVGDDGPAGFLSKSEYLGLFSAVRGATIAAVGELDETDLDRPTSDQFREWTPTLGHLLLMTAQHTTMHAGQFSVIRRKLGKPVLM